MKKRLLPFIIRYIAYPLQNLILATCTVEIDGLPNFYKAVRSGPTVICMWHNRLSPFINILFRMGDEALTYKFTSLTSKSRDGALMAKLLTAIPKNDVIRVPGEGKHNALRSAIKAFKEPKTILCLTPDGPRGPKYKVKSGIALLARSAEANLVAMSWTSNRFIELSSWDNFRIPLPFTKIHVTMSEPLQFSRKKNKIEEDTKRIQEVLDLIS